jgi:hypothetical protein
MDESREILTMRAMAWERAKGELKAYLQTYWVYDDTDFRELKDRIDCFILDFENDFR